MIHIAQPSFGKEEIEAVTGVLRSGFVASGPRVLEFEKQFADYCGAKYAVTTNSGTAALHAALYACGIGPGDEVITTPFTFVATANVILQQGATPVFCDIDPVTFNIDPAALKGKINIKTKAILPVDIFGHLYDAGRIQSIAAEWGLKVIEDACQAHGAAYHDRKAGTLGDVGCFSFYATKNITTGEGGMLVTDSEEYAERARMFRHHGQSQKMRYHYFDMGYNYRMTDLAAAIGLVQMKKLDGFNQRRIDNAALLTDGLKNVAGIITPSVEEGYRHVFHQYAIRVTDEFPMTRDELSTHLTEQGIGNAVFYPKAIHLFEHIRKEASKSDTFPVAEKMTREVLSLPVHPLVLEDDVRHIIDTINAIIL